MISNSKSPIESLNDESEMIEIKELGIKGNWINKNEELNWQAGSVLSTDYNFNNRIKH